MSLAGNTTDLENYTKIVLSGSYVPTTSPYMVYVRVVLSNNGSEIIGANVLKTTIYGVDPYSRSVGTFE